MIKYQQKAILNLKAGCIRDAVLERCIAPNTCRTLAPNICFFAETVQKLLF